jgi:hypothetical protein
MKLTIVLLLLTCGLTLSNADTTSQAQCIAACKAKCSASLEACKKRATTTGALAACQTSYKTCTGNCLNKACTSSPSR